MKTIQFFKVGLVQSLYLFPFSLSLLAQSAAASIPEVPITIYGKVIVAGDAATYQLFDGDLELTLVDETDASNVVTVSGDLFNYGPSGIFSYKLEIDREYLPHSEDLSDTLKIAATATGYRFRSITVNGESAALMDSDRSLVETKFETRDEEFRLDLLVTLDATDTDGDGMPDVWEELYGLNPNWAGDADLDEDDDAWTNLEELKNGSDPTVDNRAPTSLTSAISVIPGARMGFYLNFLDSDQDPDILNVFARLEELPAGVRMFQDVGSSVTEFTTGSTVVYQARQLDGVYYMEIDEDFTGGSVRFDLRDNNISNGEITVELLAFTPASLAANQADLWYDAESAQSITESLNLVTAWSDIAGTYDNAAYQPISGAEPFYDSSVEGSVIFDGSDYLFVDDTGIDYSAFTVFAALTPSALVDTDQVIFGNSTFEVGINGSASETYADVLHIQSAGNELVGPGLTADERFIFSYSQDETGGLFRDLALMILTDRESTSASESTFATLGARYAFDSGSAEDFFQGGVHEFIVFPESMDAKLKSRVEDYFVGRWQSPLTLMWDFRLETAPITMSGSSDTPNVFSGGWGDDVFVGRGFSDIFRDGAGSDSLTGAGGADVFQFFRFAGDNSITDFDYSEGDVIDLSPIFAGLTGAPDAYLTLESNVVLVPGSIPTVNTKIILDFEGDGTEDASISLEGLRYLQTDLEWLVGEGHIVTGGPAYPSSIDLVAEAETVDELPNEFVVTINRSGSTESALSMTVNISGTASLDDDYVLDGLSGMGANRTLTFERGESSTTISVTPVPDVFDETESIRFSILPENWLANSDESLLDLVLQDAEWLIVETVQAYAERLNQAPGIVRLTRSGHSGEAMAVDLKMSGTAENGIDYEYVVPSVTFEAGETIKDIQLKPIASGNIAGGTMVAQVSVVPDTLRYNLLNPWTSSISFIDRYTGTLNNFDEFIELNEVYPDSELIEDALLGDTDNDTIVNFLEYAWGTDPNVADDPTEFQLQIHTIDGHLELWAKTDDNPTDLVSTLLHSTDLVDFDDASDLFDLLLEPQSDGTILRRYRSKFPVSGTDSQFFALSFDWIETLRSNYNFANAIFDENRSYRFEQDGEQFLGSGNVPWVPSIEEEGVMTPDMSDDESAGFVTNVDGPFDLDFEWKISSDPYGDEMYLYVDGVEVDSITGEVDWTSVSYSNSDEGMHTIEILYEKDEGYSSGEDRAYVRKFDVDSE